MAELEVHARSWTEGLREMDAARPLSALSKPVVFWYHDESTFYANDRRGVSWIHSSETAKPKPKGEGASLMIADFVSAEYGWLQSPDGLESAQEVFRTGARRDGYFTNANNVQRAEKAMGILERYYPSDRHILIFDNASTHTNRADDALSARSMSKKPTQARFQMWGVDVPLVDNAGRQLYDEHRKPLKQRVCMGDACARLPGGGAQSLYFHAKRLYRLNPPSPLEDDLERNVLKSLQDVPIETIRK
jgi:hypothetical protein